MAKFGIDGQPPELIHGEEVHFSITVRALASKLIKKLQELAKKEVAKLGLKDVHGLD